MELTEKLDHLQVLRQSNSALLIGLTREGMGDISMGMARMEMLIEALLPWGDGDNEARIDFEVGWETKAHEVLNSLQAEIARAKLTQGVHLASVPGTPNGHRP